MGSKGARLTMKLSLAGRYVVYVVGGSGVGVSRRLPPAERDRLRELCKSLRVRNAGLIVRTAAEGKGIDELHADAQYLSRLWSRLKTKIDKVKAPGLLYAEVDVALETIRDLFNESCESVIVDSPKQFKEIVTFLDKVAPHLKDRVQLYEDDEPLFETYGIEPQIADALERRVSLPSGGNLVIDHTEALTVIDVNSGRYTGGKGLEETITHTNLEAAREVVRQLRLRDIGGIIIIDFIDMSYARNREAVLRTSRGRARDRPHQDLRGRALAARPGRDDAPEHDRRRSRHPDQDLPTAARARRASWPKRRWRSPCSTPARLPAYVTGEGLPDRDEPRVGERMSPTASSSAREGDRQASLRRRIGKRCRSTPSVLSPRARWPRSRRNGAGARGAGARDRVRVRAHATARATPSATSTATW